MSSYCCDSSFVAAAASRYDLVAATLWRLICLLHALQPIVLLLLFLWLPVLLPRLHPPSPVALLFIIVNMRMPRGEPGTGNCAQA